jgi:hypothetical protein
MFTINHASRVVCVRALDYELPVDTAFHPALLSAAQSRICASLEKRRLAAIVKSALEHPAAKRVWAIVIEEANNPVYIIRNLAYTGTKLAFRRVLLVKCESISQEEEYKRRIAQIELYFDLIDIIIVMIVAMLVSTSALLSLC